MNAFYYSSVPIIHRYNISDSEYLLFLSLQYGAWYCALSLQTSLAPFLTNSALQSFVICLVFPQRGNVPFSFTKFACLHIYLSRN